MIQNALFVLMLFSASQTNFMADCLQVIICELVGAACLICGFYIGIFTIIVGVICFCVYWAARLVS